MQKARRDHAAEKSNGPSGVRMCKSIYELRYFVYMNVILNIVLVRV